MRLKKHLIFYLLLGTLFIVLLTGFERPTAATSTHGAKIEEIIGTAWIQKAGGHLSVRAYVGMEIQEGDRLTTKEPFSSVKITFAETLDTITLADHVNITFSKIRMENGQYVTSLFLKSGAILSSVTPMDERRGIFEVKTANQTLHAKGTNFYIGVDPVTGISSLNVFSGIVQDNRDTTVVYPAQQFNAIPDLEPGDGLTYLDFEHLVTSLNPTIIQAIMQNRDKIVAENNALLEKIREGLNEDLPSGILEDEALSRYQSNVERVLHELLKSLNDKNKLQPNLQEVFRELDEALLSNGTPSWQLSTDEVDKIQQSKERALEQRKAAEEKKRMEEERLGQLAKELEARLQEQRKQQQLAAELRRKNSEAAFLEKLDEHEKERFNQSKEQRAQELAAQKEARENINAQMNPPPRPPSPPTPPVTPAPSIDTQLAAAKARIPIDLSLYTEESWGILHEAREMSEATNEDKINKTAAILSAISQLVIREIPSIDAQLEDARNQIPSDSSLYTEESWDALHEAMEMSEETDEDKINKTEAILSAISNLVMQSE